MGYEDYKAYVDSYETEEKGKDKDDCYKRNHNETEEKDKDDCHKRNYPTGDALEEAYRAGRKDGRKEGFCEGYEKGARDECKRIKEKVLNCVDKIECCK